MTLWCEATARGCLAQDTRRSPSTCLSHSVVRFQLHRSAKNTSAFLHTAPRMRSDNRFVYILRSVSDPHRHYVGATSDVTTRLGFHNAGLSAHTAKCRPWELVVALEFTEEQSARRFEKYLKSGSGRAFAKRHFA